MEKSRAGQIFPIVLAAPIAQQLRKLSNAPTIFHTAPSLRLATDAICT
jgi:hypothetical protein